MQVSVIIFLTLFSSAVCRRRRALSSNKGTYDFYRNLDKKAEEYGTRRVFGGELAEVAEFPNICYLEDTPHNVKCSCSIIASRWALTAGHCVTGKSKYLRYNTRVTSAGDRVRVIGRYIHPDFKVTHEDEGFGMDVTALYHDIGMVKVDQDMVLDITLDEDPLLMMRREHTLVGNEVKIMGYGKADEQQAENEQLFSVRLRIRKCGRSTWIPCICGVTDPGLRTRGVCRGDSGGPVIKAGQQVAVTSMGPIECVTRTDPSPGATSVFTLVKDYVNIINDTILGKFGTVTMQPILTVVSSSGCKRVTVNGVVFTVVLVLLCFLQ